MTTLPPSADAEGYTPVASDLIRRLSNVLGLQPVTAHEVKIRAEESQLLLTELSRIGVDSHALVHYAFARKATIPLLGALTGILEIGISVESWWGSLALPHSALGSETQAETALQPTVIDNVATWARQAPIADILTFSAPTREQLHEYQLVDRKYFDNGEHYVWLYCRAVEGDLTRWPDSALLLEYRWRNELEPAHFPEHALTEEGPDSNLLNEQIAFRAATAKMTNISKTNESAELLWQLQDTAVSFLGKSRAREAAALFEFHTKRYPGDARGLNNWGFCKFPLDPSSALALLQQAERLGFDDKLVNVYNQICCLVSLNRIGEALDRAENYWQRELEDDIGGFQHPGGWVWIASEGEFSFCYEDHVLHIFALLMAAVSDQLNLPERANRWRARAQETLPETM